MRTIHNFIGQYPISLNSKKLILGTIHPHNVEAFKIKFFYGNRLSLWNILNDAFDKAIGDEISVDGILKFLNSRKIAISDTVVECRRKHSTALDKDLIPEKLNYQLLEQIKLSKINEIFFTSGFGKNNAFKLFYEDILRLKITQEIKRERSVILDIIHFGRPIKLTVLLSPSGSANGRISTSPKYLAVKETYANISTPIKQYRIDEYKKAFD